MWKKVKFNLRANPRDQFSFPKKIRDEWGHELELIPTLNGGAIFQSDFLTLGLSEDEAPKLFGNLVKEGWFLRDPDGYWQ
jgi:hypothetical protein